MTTKAEQLIEEIFNYNLDDLMKEMAAVENELHNTNKLEEKRWEELVERLQAIEARLFKQEKMVEWVPLYFEYTDHISASRRLYSYRRYLRDTNWANNNPAKTAKAYYYKYFINYYENYVDSISPMKTTPTDL